MGISCEFVIKGYWDYQLFWKIWSSKEQIRIKWFYSKRFIKYDFKIWFFLIKGGKAGWIFIADLRNLKATLRKGWSV
jgi:hypothetical protein